MSTPSAHTASPHPLAEKLAKAPTAPGVYLLKDAEGTILYIGKARLLKKRLAAYAKAGNQLDAKTGALVEKVVDLETIVTESEKEALILESSLIKKHRPRYNVDLKDDKRYPSLRLDLDEAYPRFKVVRKIGMDDAMYFGPFASAQAVRETLKIINRTFKLRKCKAGEFRTRTRPCLHCQMDGCLAPCCRDVPQEKYREQVNEAILFLKGRTQDLIKKIRRDMQAAADAQAFEKAARLRDKLLSIERTVEKQIAVTTDFKDRDVFAIAGSAAASLVTVLAVRGGVLDAARHYPLSETLGTAVEALGEFIRHYYDRRHFIPAEVLTAEALEDEKWIGEWLSTLKGRRVRLHHPRRGPKRRLTEMAVRNAESELKRYLDAITSERMLLNRLQKRLKLSRLPERIECFDNSNLGGRVPVASMVVFKNGQPLKTAYRTYRIQTVKGPDDYASMEEVLRRRFLKTAADAPRPDLLMVDGGKGQLNIAVSVLQDLELIGSVDVIGIAKRDNHKGETQDKIFKPGRANPVAFGRDGDLLLFLQRIRDEAHRFAIGFHRRRRGRKALASRLESVPGIGPQRRKVLLKRFKSIDGIRTAPVDEIAALPGFHRDLALRLKSQLKNMNVD
jgi:excinuclease ABC subunit C